MDDRKVTGPSRRKSFDTRVIHGGRGRDEASGAIVPPIVQSATFEIPDVRAGAELMRGTRSGSIYTRLGNPTVMVLEAKMNALEGKKVKLADPGEMDGLLDAVAYEELLG